MDCQCQNPTDLFSVTLYLLLSEFKGRFTAVNAFNLLKQNTERIFLNKGDRWHETANSSPKTFQTLKRLKVAW